MRSIARSKWGAGLASSPLYIFIAILLSSLPVVAWILAIIATSILVDFLYSKALNNFSETNRSHMAFMGFWILIQILIIGSWFVGVGLINETT
ncbi:hypothetical protein IOQ59_10175 [Pontibacterium sp. N1Y112]|uniref:Uncharacterized protein n=1 Tax=Pontibacterium sinense TaxID=2781979 RepID=A0A8J7FDE1_9GAMM|nr:hypothetical protein [Pontibacterium sinense]MBE9397626.1 hypothetical protein [Pontibacterium sinense]